MKISVCLLACALTFPAAVLAADPFVYDYAEVTYQHQIPQSGPTIKGPGVDFSFTVYPTLQVLGGYAWLDAATPISGTTYKDYFAGIRGENNFSDSTDFFTDILYVNDYQSYQGAGSTDSGYRLTFGMRHLFMPWLEFDGSVGHNWLNQASNDVTVGLLLHATGRLAVGVNYSHNGVTNNTAGLLLRWYF